MAEAVQEKSHGLKFAERQLLRHGWEHGKGLGRAEDGISEAIKVKVKCDKGGVGHKEGEQFSFHWWDHVFNKASSSLQVEADHNGVQLKKTGEEEDGDGKMVSNKKPRKAALEKSKLYGCFVKSATLLSGCEQPEPKEAESEDSSSEEDDETLDLSSSTKLSDSDLVKVCGGRTAHKGARHGLTMSAKLARLEQQEAEFMARYGRKSQSESSSSACGSREEEKKKSAETENAEETDAPHKKKKKKKKKRRAEEEEEEEEELICLDDSEENTKKKQKKKKKKGEEDSHECQPEKKKKKKRSEPEEEEEKVTVKTKRKKCKKNKTDEKKSKD